MNCFAITTSYLQTKIRVIHIFQTRDFVNIGFSEITVNDHIMTFSDSNCNEYDVCYSEVLLKSL